VVELLSVRRRGSARLARPFRRRLGAGGKPFGFLFFRFERRCFLCFALCDAQSVERTLALIVL
jgi:hypothetical protein